MRKEQRRGLHKISGGWTLQAKPNHCKPELFRERAIQGKLDCKTFKKRHEEVAYSAGRILEKI